MPDSPIPLVPPKSPNFASPDLAWTIVENVPEGIVVIDGAGIIHRINSAVGDMFGYSDEELLGNNVTLLMGEHDAAHHHQHLETYMATGQANVIGIGREVSGKTKDGQQIPIELAVAEVITSGERLFVGVLRDISERRETEQLLRMTNKIGRAVNLILSNAINEGLSKREIFNSALSDLLEITESEYGFIGEILLNDERPYLKTHAITNIAWNYETRKFYKENAKDGLEFFNLDTLFGVTIRSGQLVIANDPYNDPRRGGLPKGHPRLNAYLGLPIYSGSKLLGMAGIANKAEGYDEDLVDQIKPLTNAIGTLIATHQNAQSKVKAEEALYATQQQLKQMATKDPVTGIANRYMLSQQLEAVYEACVGREEMALLFIDVDRFKNINDGYGHDVGDRVLRHLAEVLEAAVRPTDVVGRWGGEEFVIGLPNCSTLNASIIAERVRSEICSEPHHGIELSVSIGIAGLELQPENLWELIRLADVAVYAAKADGRNCVRIAGNAA